MAGEWSLFQIFIQNSSGITGGLIPSSPQTTADNLGHDSDSLA